MKGLIVNDWDRDNLNFLLNSSPATLADWNAQCDPDDLEYAQELLAAYALELKLQAQDLTIEARMSLMFEYPDAGRVIGQFRLTK